MIETDTADEYTQLEHYQRLQPGREAPTEAAAALVAAFGTVAGLGALWFSPIKLGAVGMALGIIALATSGQRDLFARIAFSVSVIGFLVGTILATLMERNPF